MDEQSSYAWNAPQMYNTTLGYIPGLYYYSNMQILSTGFYTFIANETAEPRGEAVEAAES